MSRPPSPFDITAIDLGVIEQALAPSGLSVLGAFHPAAVDIPHGVAPPPLPIKTMVLIGNGGGAFWPIFSAQRRDEREPLDCWTHRILAPIAAALNAELFFPFDGPPYLPFQRWAATAGIACPSPIGTLIHPVFGPWHAYRGALGFARRLPLRFPGAAPTICLDCAARPCLSACPVGAFATDPYDVGACARHLRGGAGRDCLIEGCRARRACPVGAAHRYPPAQAAFHMRAFLRARDGDTATAGAD